MKKLLSVILALAMVLALGVTAFAENVTVKDDDLTSGEWKKDDITVGATYTAGGKTYNDVYSVKVSWVSAEANDLKYVGATTTYTWNPETLVWDSNDNTTAGWSGSATVNVTVTNCSSKDIKATVSGNANYGLSITGEQSATVKTKSTGNGKSDSEIDNDEAFEVKVSVPESGTSAPQESDATDGKVTAATITITLSKTATTEE